MLKRGLVVAALALAACGGSSSGPATKFVANLAAANEVPPNASTATGTATYTFDADAGVVSYTITYSGLTTKATLAHIHAGQAGVNGTPAVNFTSSLPANQTSGTISGSFGASAVLAGATPDGGVAVTAGDMNSLIAAMRAGNTYTNVHTTQNGGGEIRAQNQPQ